MERAAVPRDSASYRAGDLVVGPTSKSEFAIRGQVSHPQRAERTPVDFCSARTIALMAERARGDGVQVPAPRQHRLVLRAAELIWFGNVDLAQGGLRYFLRRDHWERRKIEQGACDERHEKTRDEGHAEERPAKDGLGSPPAPRPSQGNHDQSTDEHPPLQPDQYVRQP